MADCNCPGEANTSIGRWAGRVGGQIGDRASAYGMNQLKRFKSWSGLGDYQLKGNSLINGYTAGDNPAVGTKGRSTTIRYREYLGDVITHPTVVGEFSITSYQINPANVITFPWLAPIAGQFDQYKPRGIIFEFRSTATDSSTTPNLGSVLMATEYDVIDSAYESKSQMLNSAYSSEAKMSDDMVHGIECDPQELQRRMFYTRPFGSTQLGDARDYNMGIFYVATNGGSLPVGTNVGSLYVHYEFELFKEQLHGGLQGLGQLFSVWENTATAGGVDMNNPFTAMEFDNIAPTSGKDMGIRLFQRTITFPKQLQGTLWRLSIYANANQIGSEEWIPGDGAGRGFVSLVGCEERGAPTYSSSNIPEVVADNASTTASAKYEFYLQLDESLSQDAVAPMTTAYGPFPTSSNALHGYAVHLELLSQRYPNF